LGDQVNSSGRVDVTGAGSKWSNSGQLFVGKSGTATMNVLAGSLVENTGAFTTIIADNSPSTASVNVDGSNSRLDNLFSGLTVGRAGHGSLMIANGGRVESIGGILGDAAGGQGVASMD